MAENDTAWLAIRAVDSSWFEVWSQDDKVLAQVKKHFNHVTEFER